MNEKQEKKQIKINLWTFYMLVASLIILLAATISGWLLVAKQNNQNTPIENDTSVSIVRTIK